MSSRANTTPCRLVALLILLGGCSAPESASGPRKTDAPGAPAPIKTDQGQAGTSGAGAGFGNAATQPVTPPPPRKAPKDGQGCAAVTQMAEAQKAPTDIIWAIDTSSSMQGARDAIQAELNMFSQRIIDAGIDAHIVVLGATDLNFCFGPGLTLCIAPPLGSGQCGGGTLAVAKVGLGLAAFCASAAIAGPGADSTDTFLHLNAASGETMQLDTILTQYEAYKHMLRPEARKQLVITGDGDATQTMPQFQQALAALDPSFAPANWSFNGVYCKQTCVGVCPAVATNYPGMVQSSGGVEGGLCDGQAGFTAVIDKLATAVIKGAQLSCEWAIPAPPSGETFDPNKVNVTYTGTGGAPSPYAKIPTGAQCGDLDGWRYDAEAAPTRIQVCPNTCKKIQADAAGRMDIEFGCETRIAAVE